MRLITLGQVLELHHRIIERSGGARGVLNLGALEADRGETVTGDHLFNKLRESA